MYVIQSASFYKYGTLQYLYVTKVTLDGFKYRVGELLPGEKDRWLYHTISADTPKRARKFATREAAEQVLARIINKTEEYKVVEM
jgi:hypothetical protein